MGTFNGRLNANEVYGALYNMLISQKIWAPEVAKIDTLVEKARVDGSMYGDTKLYYSSDAYSSRKWLGDAEAANLLSLHRPKAPECQAIVLDVFRIIELTTDSYLTKRAWMDQGAFSAFNNTMVSWMSVTKQIYDETTYNAYIGTTITNVGKQLQSLTINLDTTLEGSARVQAQTIAERLANIITDLTVDERRDYNDYGHIRRYSKSDLQIIWNASWVNKITKLDLPTIFHKDIMESMSEMLPAKYFGTVITSDNVGTYSASTPAAGKPIDSDDHTYVPGSNNANGMICALEEMELTVGGEDYHMFPGEELPAGAVLYTSATNNLYGKVYIVNPKVICKVTIKGSVPFMSAFQTETNFFNPKSLTETKFLIWGHNTLEYLKNFPFVTLLEA